MIKLAEGGQVPEAMLILKRESSKVFLRSHEHFEKSLISLSLKSKGAIKKFDFSQFILPKGFKKTLVDSVNKNLTVSPVGAPGTGKTQFIKTVVIEKLGLRPLIINNYDSIRRFNPHSFDCIIIDNFNFYDLNQEEIIALFDSENEVTLKVQFPNVLIPAYTPRFVIHNKMFSDILPLNLHMDPAILRRLKTIYI